MKLHRLKHYFSHLHYILFVRYRRYIPEPLLRGSCLRRLNVERRHLSGTSLQWMELNTPDGLNQCTHPDMVRMPDGSFLLAVTPYPFGFAAYERPVIYRSTDAVSWTYLAGPIDQQQPGERNHLSDPTLALIGGTELVCWYRECVYNLETPLTNLYCMKSRDGVHWGEKRCVCSHPMAEYDVISPSLKWEENRGLHGYFCLKREGRMALMYTADGEFSGDSVREIDLSPYLPAGKTLWHVSHVCGRGQDYLLLTLSDDFGGGNSQLYLGAVSHGASGIHRLRKLPVREQDPRIQLEYRACGLLHDDAITVCASVQFQNRMWGCITFETTAD